MFQIKDFVSIVASMVNMVRAVSPALTDFNVGSVARTMLEAPAMEVEELHQHLRIGLTEAIPVSVYRSFNHDRLPATAAQGVVILELSPRNQDTMLTAGSTFTTASGAALVTLSDLTIPAATTLLSVVMEARTVGTAGNLAAGVELNPSTNLPGLIRATVGDAGISGGRPEESDDDRKFRFNEYIRTLARGTPEALRYGLSLVQVPRAGGGVERIVSAEVEEMYRTDPNNGPGWVRCHISAGAEAPSSALLARASEVLHGYRDALGQKVAGWAAAGVRTDVLAALRSPAAFTCRVTPAEGYTKAEAEAAVLAVLQDYTMGMAVGESLLVAEASARCMDLAQVGNIRFTRPADDINPGPYGAVSFGGVTFA